MAGCIRSQVQNLPCDLNIFNADDSAGQVGVWGVDGVRHWVGAQLAVYLVHRACVGLAADRSLDRFAAYGYLGGPVAALAAPPYSGRPLDLPECVAARPCTRLRPGDLFDARQHLVLPGWLEAPLGGRADYE